MKWRLREVNGDMHLVSTKLFGKPEPRHVKLGQEGIVDNFITIGNVQDDCCILGNDHHKTKLLTNNNMWHSDSSFRTIPTYISIMCAYEVPMEGGKTEFVSQRAAYKRLPVEN
jgi:alpha-ketoglutarate-dependent 2,4-dichlorophenoxyacetate dioxygenase